MPSSSFKFGVLVLCVLQHAPILVSAQFQFQDFYDFKTLGPTDNYEELYPNIFSTSWARDVCGWEFYPEVLPRKNFKENVFVSNNVPGSFLSALALRTIGTKIIDDETRIQAGELQTRNSVHFGSFRAIAKIAEEPGTKFGVEYYRNDFSQITIEIVTKNLNNSTGLGYPIDLIILPEYLSRIYVQFNPKADFHEYRIDWTAESVSFWIDGVIRDEVRPFQALLPSEPGYIVVNHWSNGVENFVGRPPKEDSISYLQSLDLRYN